MDKPQLLLLSTVVVVFGVVGLIVGLTGASRGNALIVLTIVAVPLVTLALVKSKKTARNREGRQK